MKEIRFLPSQLDGMSKDLQSNFSQLAELFEPEFSLWIQDDFGRLIIVAIRSAKNAVILSIKKGGRVRNLLTRDEIKRAENHLRSDAENNLDLQ